VRRALGSEVESKAVFFQCSLLTLWPPDWLCGMNDSCTILVFAVVDEFGSMVDELWLSGILVSWVGLADFCSSSSSTCLSVVENSLVWTPYQHKFSLFSITQPFVYQISTTPTDINGNPITTANINSYANNLVTAINMMTISLPTGFALAGTAIATPTVTCPDGSIVQNGNVCPYVPSSSGGLQSSDDSSSSTNLPLIIGLTLGLGLGLLVFLCIVYWFVLRAGATAHVSPDPHIVRLKQSTSN